MTKGDKGKMPLSMLVYFSKKRPKTAIIKRTKAERRHLLADIKAPKEK